MNNFYYLWQYIEQKGTTESCVLQSTLYKHSYTLQATFLSKETSCYVLKLFIIFFNFEYYFTDSRT